MRQQAIALLDERQAVLADLAADPDIFVLDLDGLIVQQLFDFSERLALGLQDDLLHAVERPRKIDCCRARRVEIRLCLPKPTQEFLIVVRLNLARCEVDADGCCVTDSRCPADRQRIDGHPDFLLRLQVQELRAPRQLRLVDDDQCMFRIVEGYRLVVHDALLFRHLKIPSLHFITHTAHEACCSVPCRGNLAMACSIARR